MLQMLTRNKKDEYDRLRREAKYTCRRKKTQMMNDHLLEVQSTYDEIRNFYKNIKRVGNNYQSRETMCGDKNGKTLVSAAEVVDRQKNYSEEVPSQNKSKGRICKVE
ncbi:hypothetical protein Trydic_g6213 [Trypoxylus dichotomus]